jgi:two-component system, cell cycle sensor histidine kinase and response regulator CckA
MAQHKKVSRKPKASLPEKSHSPYILLVEDEPTHVAVMRHTIQSANPNVIVKVAGSLKEYRSALEKSLPEIALIDMHLPDGKALEVLTSPPEAGLFPIVVMTSSGDEKIAVKAMKAGALDYIVKTTESFKAMPHTIERSLHEWKLIQESKQAEKALNESERRFRSLYENVIVGLYRTTPAGKILLANRALMKMLGYSSFEKLAERNLAKAGFSKSSQRKEFLRIIETENEINDFESTWVRQDGSLVIVRESARAIRDSQGKTLYYDGAVEDITERRLAEAASRHAEEALGESEEKFRSIAENFHDILFITDTKGIITYISSAVNQFFGYTSEEMKGRFFGEYLDETELPRILPIFEHSIQRGTSTKKLSLLAKRRDGKNFLAELDTSIIIKNGKVRGTTGVIRDISERRQVEEALRESESKFRSTFENSTIGVALVGLDGKYLMVNQTLSEIFGYPIEELLGTAFTDITHPEDAEKSRTIFREVLDGKGKCIRFAKRYIHKDGHIIWAEVSSATVYNTAGSPLYFVTHTSDITERKRSEEALRNSEEKFRKAFMTSPDSININRLGDGSFVSINQGFTRIMGYTEEETRGKTSIEINIWVDLDDRNRLLAGLKKDGVVENLVARFRSKTGEIKEGMMSASIIELDGVQYILSITRDITERKRAEETLRLRESYLSAIIENQRGLLWLKDQNGRFLAVNNKFANACGLDNPEFVVSKTDLDVWPRELAERYIADDNKVIQSKKQYTVEEPISDKGDIHWFETFKTPIIDNQGRVIGTTGYSHDITERKQTEVALQNKERYQRALLDNFPFAVWMKDTESRFLAVNQLFAETFNISTADELVGKNDFDITERNIAETYRADDRVVMESRQKNIAEEELVGLGEHRWFETYKAPVIGKNDELLGTVGFLRDISERKRSEEALRESESQFRELWGATVEGIVIEDKGTIIEVNDAMCKMFGIPRERAVGKSLLEFVPSEMRDHLRERIIAETEGRFETSALRSDGTRITLETFAKKFIYQGKSLRMVTARDITERKRVEELLDNERNLLRTLIDTLPDKIYIKDTEGRFIVCNKATATRLGVSSPEDVIGKSDFDLLPHELAARFRDDEQKIIKSGQSLMNHEEPLDQLSGTTRWNLVTKVPFHDTHGNIKGIVGSGRDITEQKQVERTLRENEQFFRLLFTTSPDSIILFDPFSTTIPWEIVDCNEVACRMNGYTREELIGKSLDMVNTKISTLEDRTAHLKKLQRESIIHFETLHRHQDGHIFPIEVASSIVTLGGHELILGIDRDITERKQAEEALRENELRFRTLYENTSVGLYRTTPNGKILMANPTLVKMLGYPSFQDLAERDLEKEGFEPSYQRKEFLEKIERDGEIKSCESKWILRDGTAIFVLESARVIRDSQGKSLYYDGTVEDITERKRVEEQLRQMQKLEGLGTLAGGIAHDFNNILGIILAYITSLKRFKGDTKKLDLAVDTITKAVDRGKTLVQQILTFARKSETAFEAMNVNDVVMEIMAMILETFPKILTYAQNFDKGIKFINADRSQMYQTLLNLCVNARDAMPNGGVLTINTCMVSGINVRHQHPDAVASGYVCIEVSDTGEGMTPEIQKRIFEPFFTTKGIGKGTGLGLSVVFGVVQNHKGYIDVESDLGKGTTFRVYLPASQDAAPIIENDEETMEEIPGGTETLLVVEDEEMLMMSLRMVLVEKGYKVLSAGDGLMALKIYQEKKNEIALVLTDLGLPNITGLEVCQRIKKIKPKERMILATGFLDPEMKSEFLKAEIRDFLYKPYDLKKVLKVIREVLDKK